MSYSDYLISKAAYDFEDSIWFAEHGIEMPAGDMWDRLIVKLKNMPPEDFSDPPPKKNQQWHR